MKTIHVIVATGVWDRDHLRYRRHRFAEYLYKQPNTEEVIWLCPGGKQKGNHYIKELANGIKQWVIPDLGNNKIFRFGRFLPIFYRYKLKDAVSYLEEKKKYFSIKLWYTYPAYQELNNLIEWDQMVYDCSDLWAEQLSGSFSIGSLMKQKVIYNSEQAIVKEADYITCTSSYLKEQIERRAPAYQKKNVFILENGVEFELFQKKDREILPVNEESFILGYIGGIKPKLDFALIQKVAQKKRNWTFLFVGPDGTNGGLEFKQLVREPNVIWTDRVSPDQVFKYMNSIDIGVMPYKQSNYNKAIFPLKLFEFLAAGKAVVGINLPSTVAYVESGIYELLQGIIEVDVFIEACREMEKQASDKKLEQRRIQLAESKNWDHIFYEMNNISSVIARGN